METRLETVLSFEDVERWLTDPEFKKTALLSIYERSARERGAPVYLVSPDSVILATVKAR